jgi:DNA-binding NarL/FixJ family response regulator
MSLQENVEPKDSPSANHQHITAPEMGRRARVVLVEDHPVYAAGLQALFSGDKEIEIVGHAADGETAMSLVRYYQPDVVLLDIGLGAANGLDLINRFRRICPDVRIAVITAHQEQEHLMAALRLGAQAFIQKDMPGDIIVDAVRQALKGERVVTHPAAMTAALTELGQLLRERERDRTMLTPQELVILRLAAEGYKNKDIGAHEFLSEVTIKRKLQDIYRKLNVTGKPAAVAEAIRLGLI